MCIGSAGCKRIPRYESGFVISILNISQSLSRGRIKLKVPSKIDYKNHAVMINDHDDRRTLDFSQGCFSHVLRWGVHLSRRCLPLARYVYRIHLVDTHGISCRVPSRTRIHYVYRMRSNGRQNYRTYQSSNPQTGAVSNGRPDIACSGMRHVVYFRKHF